MYEQDDGAIITELVWADAGQPRCPMLCEAIITQTRPWCSHISNTIIRLLNSVEKSCSVDWAAQRIKSPETIWLQFDNALNETLNNFLPWHLLKLQNTSGNRYWQYYTAIHGALAGPRQWRIVIDIKKGCLHPGWYLEPYGIAGTVTYLTPNYLKSGVWRSRGWQLVFLMSTSVRMRTIFSDWCTSSFNAVLYFLCSCVKLNINAYHAFIFCTNCATNWRTFPYPLESRAM